MMEVCSQREASRFNLFISFAPLNEAISVLQVLHTGYIHFVSSFGDGNICSCNTGDAAEYSRMFATFRAKRIGHDRWDSIQANIGDDTRTISSYATSLEGAMDSY